MSTAYGIAVNDPRNGSAGNHPEQAVRKLAHELRQPLSAIEAIAYYLEMTLPTDQLQARQHLLRLQQLIERSNGILNQAVSESSQS